MARTLLGSLLVTQIATWRNIAEIAPDADEEEIAAANTRRREEAEKLLGGVLRTALEAPTPKADLAALAEVLDEGDHPEGQDLASVPLPPGHPTPQRRAYYGFTLEVG